MRINKWNRMFVAATVIGAASLAGAGVTARAVHPSQQEQKKQPDVQKDDPQKPDEHKPRPRRPQEQKPGQQAKPRAAQPKALPQATEPPRLPQANAQRPQQQPSRAQPGQAQQRLPRQQQQQRVGDQQRQLAQYRDQLDQQQRLAPQRDLDLQRQHRTAQYAFRQQYLAGLRDQQMSIPGSGSYDYGADPSFSTPPAYRYTRDGRSFETNEYGALVLRKAVNDGYAQGYGAGRADRLDRWPFSCTDSYVYQDGIYGYRGFYVERDDYRYYFREGFRRGYDDGYHERYQYGAQTTGRHSILDGVLSVIINLQPLR
jgi:hypothetical protein